MYVAKGYDALLPFAERIAHHSSEYSLTHLSAIEAYIRTVKEVENLRARLFPMLTLNKEERLRKVAAHCGLAMPRAMASSEIADGVTNQASDATVSIRTFATTPETPNK